MNDTEYYVVIIIISRKCTTHCRQRKTSEPLPQLCRSFIIIVGQKCTLAMSHAAAWWVAVSIPTGRVDRVGRTPDRYITLLVFARLGQRNDAVGDGKLRPGYATWRTRRNNAGLILTDGLHYVNVIHKTGSN